MATYLAKGTMELGVALAIGRETLGSVTMQVHEHGCARMKDSLLEKSIFRASVLKWKSTGFRG